MGLDCHGREIKLGNHLLMLTCIFSVKIHLYQFYLGFFFKKTKIDNKIISDESDYYFGLLGISLIRIQHANAVPSMATRVELRRSKFDVWFIYAFIDQLENPFILVHFNAIHI